MRWYQNILRHAFPQRYVWVEWNWGTVKLYRVRRWKADKTSLYIFDALGDRRWIRHTITGWDGEPVPFQDHYVKRWAPYRAWWQEPLPQGPDPDDQYKIKINVRARLEKDGNFPPS